MAAANIVAIGASAGGSRALAALLHHLPATYALPVLVVKHHSATEGAGDGRDFVKWLNSRLALNVCLAEDKDTPQPGTVMVAPPDYHLLLNTDGSVSLSQDDAVIYARPSVDVLFESIADACGDKTVGVVLTGASQDGAAGAKKICQAGGKIYVQNPATAEAPVMPRAVLAACEEYRAPALDVLAIDCLAVRLLELGKKGMSNE